MTLYWDRQSDLFRVFGVAYSTPGRNQMAAAVKPVRCSEATITVAGHSRCLRHEERINLSSYEYSIAQGSVWRNGASSARLKAAVSAPGEIDE